MATIGHEKRPVLIRTTAAFVVTAAILASVLCQCSFAMSESDDVSNSLDAMKKPSPQEYMSTIKGNDPEIWRVANRCGVNTLYMYLALHDVETSYDELLGRMPITQQGTSLRELREMAETFGLKTIALKATPDKLPLLLPAIVHREEEAGYSGHYDIVLSRTSDIVTYIDGTSGCVNHIEPTDFDQSWTGHLLTLRSDHLTVENSSRAELFAAALTLAVCIGFALYPRPTRKTLVRLPGPRGSHQQTL